MSPKKKIFYVANVNLFSGKANAIQLVKMCEALIGQGLDLTLVIPRRSQNKKNVRELYGLARAIPLVRLPVFSLFPKTGVGFNISALSFMKMSFLYLLWQKIRGQSFTIYTIDLDQFSYALLPLLAPTIIEAHGSKRVTFFTRFFFSHIKGLFAVSEAVRQSLVKTFSITAPSHTLPNGIDLEVFNPSRSRSSVSFPEVKRPVFLYSGRAYAWKGLETIVGALSIDKDIRGVFVGDTKEDLETALPDGNLVPDNFLCVGRRPFQEIPSWLSWADFFIVSGTAKDRYSFFETSPMKLFEYLAYGKPIIAVDSPAIREIVNEDEVTFYKADDPADLARVMRFVLEHRSELEARSKELIEKAKQYSWTKRAERVKEFLITHI